MRVSTAISIALVMLASCGAQTPEPTARDRIDRIVRSADRLDSGGRRTPDLTTEVNALLASDPKVVRDALEDALAMFRRRTRVEDEYRLTLESLVALLAGAKFETQVDRPIGAVFEVRHGFVLTRFEGDGVFFSGVERWKPAGTLRSYAGGRFRLRAPPALDGPALLDDLCGADPMPADRSDVDELCRSAGLAIGFAARKDDALARHILRLAGEMDVSKADLPRFEVLCFALGRLGTSEADLALERMIIGAVAGEYPEDAFETVVEAARCGIGEEFVGRMRRRLTESFPAALESFDLAAGGEAIVRLRLDAARESPDPVHLASLADAIGNASTPLEVETFLSTLDLGLEKGSAAVLSELLWVGPGLPGSLDPLELGRRFCEDVRSGRIALRPGELESPGIYGDFVAEDFDAEMTAEVVEGDGEDEVRVTLRNRDDGPCALNPAAFDYAVIIRQSSPWKIGDPWDPNEAVPHVQFGWVAEYMVPTVRARDLLLLEPGASASFTCPLGGGVPREGRLYVSLKDAFSVEGDPPAPLYRNSDTVRAR